MLEVLLFISVLLLALSAGVAFSHVLEIPGKRRLPPDTVIAIHNNLYAGYRYTGLTIELATLVALAWAAIVAYGPDAAFWLTIGALAAHLSTAIVFVSWTDRENRRIAMLHAGHQLSDGWIRILSRWEWSHGTRALLFLMAIGLSLGALIAN